MLKERVLLSWMAVLMAAMLFGSSMMVSAQTMPAPTPQEQQRLKQQQEQQRRLQEQLRIKQLQAQQEKARQEQLRRQQEQAKLEQQRRQQEALRQQQLKQQQEKARLEQERQKQLQALREKARQEQLRRQQEQAKLEQQRRQQEALRQQQLKQQQEKARLEQERQKQLQALREKAQQEQLHRQQEQARQDQLKKQKQPDQIPLTHRGLSRDEVRKMQQEQARKQQIQGSQQTPIRDGKAWEDYRKPHFEQSGQKPSPSQPTGPITKTPVQEAKPQITPPPYEAKPFIQPPSDKKRPLPPGASPEKQKAQLDHDYWLRSNQLKNIQIEAERAGDAQKTKEIAEKQKQLDDFYKKKSATIQKDLDATKAKQQTTTPAVLPSGGQATAPEVARLEKEKEKMAQGFRDQWSKLTYEKLQAEYVEKDLKKAKALAEQQKQLEKQWGKKSADYQKQIDAAKAKQPTPTPPDLTRSGQAATPPTKDGEIKDATAKDKQKFYDDVEKFYQQKTGLKSTDKELWATGDTYYQEQLKGADNSIQQKKEHIKKAQKEMEEWANIKGGPQTKTGAKEEVAAKQAEINQLNKDIEKLQQDKIKIQALQDQRDKMSPPKPSEPPPLKTSFKTWQEARDDAYQSYIYFESRAKTDQERLEFRKMYEDRMKDIDAWEKKGLAPKAAGSYAGQAGKNKEATKPYEEKPKAPWPPDPDRWMNEADLKGKLEPVSMMKVWANASNLEGGILRVKGPDGKMHIFLDKRALHGSD